MHTWLHRIEGPWRGRLAIAPRPRGGDWLEDEMKGWRGEGIGLVVSLLTSEENQESGLEAESAACESVGMRFRSFPIVDRDVPADNSSAIELLKELDQVLRNGMDVAIHCRQGVGRSGLIALALLIQNALGTEEAIERVSKARGVAVPETEQQRMWLVRFENSV